MGSRGPLPRTVQQHILAGNPRHLAQASLIIPRTKALEPYTGEAPAYLADDELEVWRELSMRLNSASQLVEVDLPAFELLVMEWSRWRRAETQVREERESGKIDFGTMSEAREAARIALNLLGAFGMTPVSRVRMPLSYPRARVTETQGKLVQELTSEPASFADFQ